jgi:uncharacterized protein YqcC (DUF446 family)
MSTEADLRQKLTKIELDMQKLCLAKQVHPSQSRFD